MGSTGIKLTIGNFFGLGEAKGGNVFREPLDSLGYLQASGLMLVCKVLYGLVRYKLGR
jgi:hypothetical protein